MCPREPAPFATTRKGRDMTSNRAHSPLRHRMLLAGGTALALALTACAPTPEPTPTPTPTVAPPQYDPQPDFTITQAPADSPRTATSTSIVISGSYADDGAPYDAAQILNASQGGYAPMTNDRWFSDRIPMMSEMGLQHIRFDHVLNDYLYQAVTEQRDGSVTYDFSRLDRTILPLIDQGMQPLLALSYTPSAWASSPWAPPPLPKWTEAVRALVTHYRDLGYTGWDWEVWNEPDGTNHWTGTFDQYNELYAATSRVVKEVDPSARVGGAAAADIASEGNVSGYFISYMAAHRDVPFDFFSLHVYRTTNWDAVAQSRQMLTDAGFADLPILITEWGNISRMNDGPGHGSDTNASSNGASYIARRLYLAAEADAERVFYFSPLEGMTFTAPYNGDLGLLTVDGHRKSPGNVFEMYSRLGDTRVELEATGAGAETQDVYGFLGKDSGGSDTTLLLWNNTPVDADAALQIADLPFADEKVRKTVRAVSGTQGIGYVDSPTAVAAAYPSANENAGLVEDVVLAGLTDLDETVRIPANGVVEVRFATTDLEEGDVVPSWEPPAVNVAAAASGAVAAASSSIEDPDDGWSTGALIDGRRYSVDLAKGAVRGWSSASHPAPDATEAATIDLGSVRPIDSVSLWPYTTKGAASSGFPLAASIKGSADGTTWSTLAEIVDDTGGAPVSGEQTFSFEVSEVRYLSVEATRLGAVMAEPSTFALQLAEIEAYRTGVPDGGFEAGALAEWATSGEATVQNTVARRGENAVLLGASSSISREIRGLRPATTYTVGAYIKDASDGARLSVALPESGSFSTPAASAGWQHVWVTFTTGSRETSAVVEVSSGSGADGAVVDDMSVAQAPPAVTE